MDYSTESSEGQQNVTIGARTEPHLGLLLYCMQFSGALCDQLVSESSQADATAVEMAVETVALLRRLASRVGVNPSSPFGRGWAHFTPSQVAHSLFTEAE
jgi:hypothetical protein